MTPPVMNQIQRDTVRYGLPHFKTTGYAGKGDLNLYIDHLKPGPYLEKKLKGYTVPSFEDLLQSLQYLPSGRDARGLTHCLAWYHDVCETFSPKLQLNVLHTQALIRALRQPLAPTGSQNLDKLALEEWRDCGTLEKSKVQDVEQRVQHKKQSVIGTKTYLRSEIVFDTHKDRIDLRIHVDVSIRHVLSFPFLALHGIIGEALQMGIDNAETKRATRKNLMTPPNEVGKKGTSAMTKIQLTTKRNRQSDTVNDISLLHTPKRQRTLRDDGISREVREPN